MGGPIREVSMKRIILTVIGVVIGVVILVYGYLFITR